jgi:transposase
MGRALSLDLRERVWKFIEGGGSRRAAARHFRISVSSAVRIAASQAERGTLEPRKLGRPPGRGKLARYVDFLVEVVEAVPDITLDELASALFDAHGVRAHPASISRVLTRARLTYKKSRSMLRNASGPTSAPRARTG